MSPAIADMAMICKLQNALKDVADLSDDTQRAAAYIRAHISDVDQALFDKDARETEQKRRDMLARIDTARAA